MKTLVNFLGFLKKSIWNFCISKLKFTVTLNYLFKVRNYVKWSDKIAIFK